MGRVGSNIVKSVNTGLSLQNILKEHPRVRLLRYIAEHTTVSVKEMKSDLVMATGVLYYHLAELEPYLKQDESKRYFLTAESRLLLDKCEGNYEAASNLLARLASATTSAPEVRKYRNLYDTIAAILDTNEPVFTRSHVIRKGKMTDKRAKDLISFMREKGLITLIDREDLPKEYS
ncbi:MAG: helix-turn-helix domain-containing protein, partial [Nitrososphaerales archaeon]